MTSAWLDNAVSWDKAPGPAGSSGRREHRQTSERREDRNRARGQRRSWAWTFGRKHRDHKHKLFWPAIVL